MIKYNVNDFVWVKLTAYGKEELEKQHNELSDKLKYSMSDYPFKLPEKDKDGYYKFQLWYLMQTFGHLMGCKSPFEMDIKLENKK